MEVKKSIEGTFALTGGDEVEVEGAAGSGDGARFNINEKFQKAGRDVSTNQIQIGAWSCSGFSRLLELCWSCILCDSAQSWDHVGTHPAP